VMHVIELGIVSLVEGVKECKTIIM
jgi:hypothetical protein